MGEDVVRFVDAAMYSAAPMEKGVTVTVVSATPDPLGVIAAVSKMYEGHPVGNTHDITDKERIHYWEEMTKTKLVAPLEFVDLHFLIEGVTRAFTHQMVRQRTAVYAQESLRFAVKDDFADAVALPPSLQVLKEDDPRVEVWKNQIKENEIAYNVLIASGIPAEDARGLLPHAITTRLHYKTNLRNLVEHVGNRLCTQAQFEWKLVIFKMMEAMRGYVSFHQDEWSVITRRAAAPGIPKGMPGEDPSWQAQPDSALGHATKWQWKVITDPKYKWFAPACYQAGRCPFKADFDRGCTIRERADRGAFKEIKVEEWAADPTAGRTEHGDPDQS